jgi:hypothetical protein
MQNQNQISVFNYDVFISYRSQQESWAARLAETLRGFGLKVWRDHDAGDGIRVGEAWSDEVRNGIRASRTMIVLWSNLIATNANTIVLQEVNEMKGLVDNDTTGLRRFVPVLLDGTPINNFVPLSPYQADVDLQSLYAQAGDGGASRVSATEWFGAVRNLVQALGIQDVMEVRFVVAAMTREQARQLYGEPETYAVNRDALRLMCEVMEKTSPFSLDRYGDSPNDWRPFPQLGPTFTIKALLNAYDDEKREEFRGRNEFAKWILVSYSDEIVAPSPQVRQGARDAINSGPSLVVIDPISLMHRDVFGHIITNASLHNRPDSFVLGVAPFVSLMHRELFESTMEIDEMLKDYLEDAYQRFSRPFVAGNNACVMNVEHEWQFTRWLQVAADSIVSARRTPMRARARRPNQAIAQRLRQQAPATPDPDVINMGMSGGVAQ